MPRYTKHKSRKPKICGMCNASKPASTNRWQEVPSPLRTNAGEPMLMCPRCLEERSRIINLMLLRIRSPYKFINAVALLVRWRKESRHRRISEKLRRVREYGRNGEKTPDYYRAMGLISDIFNECGEAPDDETVEAGVDRMLKVIQRVKRRP
jgi:hypothetical protein